MALPTFRAVRRTAALAALLLAALPLSGCEVIGFFAGHGDQKALYTLPPKARILVLVDMRPELAAPPSWANTFADHIGAHLYRNLAAENLVGQDRLIELQRDPARFRKLGVADIAAETNADIVLVVYVVLLNVSSTVDGSVTEGQAVTLVKVISRDGTKLWPGEVAGHKVDARVEPGLTSDKDSAQVYTQLMDLLTVRIGRMFHAYDLENKAMTH